MFEGWLILFVFLIVVEIATVNLVSIWFALGALVTAIVSLFTNNITILLASFVVSSTLFLILTKPFLDKYRKGKIVPTNLDMVIGKIGVVTVDIEMLEPGEVNVYGKRWSAVSDTPIKKDSKVEILAIDGVKLKVKEIKEDI